MLKNLYLEDVLSFLVLTIFALGWMDLGQGPQYTWWGLMYFLGNQRGKNYEQCERIINEKL